MKKTVKKILCGMLAAAMLAGLAGCGKKDETTADGLMAQISSIDPAAYNACHLEMDMSAAQEGTEVSLTAAMDIEACGKTAHVSNGNITLGATGMNFAMTMDAWMDGNTGYSYTKAGMMGMDSGWMKSALDSGSNFSGMGAMSSMWPDGTQFVLAEREKDADYTVTWNVPAQALKDAMSSIPDEGVDAFGGNVSVNDDMLGSLEGCDCTAVFDKDSKAVKSMSVRVSGGDVQNMELRLSNITFNGEARKLAVPAEVLETAAEDLSSGWSSGTGDFSGGFSGEGFDEGFSYDGGSSGQDGAYLNDGDGYDEVIDGLGAKLSADMPADCSVDITHYSDYAEMRLDYYPASGWHGSATVRNVSDDSYGGAAGYYESSVGFYEGWYETEPYDKGEDYAIFLRDGELDYVCIVGDMTIDASVYADAGTDYETMVSYVQDLLAMAGVN